MIDNWLPKNGWPPDVVATMRRFRQGHIIPWNSFAYGAAFRNPVCSHTSAVADSDALGYVKVEDAWPYVIIISQTCDVCEDGKKNPRMPWISASPVYDILPYLRPGQANQIRANGFGYLVPLTHPRFIHSDALWVADLSLSFPLEKSVLVGHSAIDGFAADEDFAYFADKLASRCNRPALDNRVRQYVVGPLGEALAEGVISHEPIREIRILCNNWDRADRVQLSIIVHDTADIETVEQQLFAWHQKTLSPQLPNDLAMMIAEVARYSEYRYEKYRRTLAVDFSSFSDSAAGLDQAS